MKIEYKIISLNDITGSIQVNYTAEGIDRPFIFQYDLPINTATNTTLTLEELDTFIMQHAPIAQLKYYLDRIAVVAGVDLTQINTLVQPLIPVIPPSVQPVSTGTNTF
jgi:hypothetical protein